MKNILPINNAFLTGNDWRNAFEKEMKDVNDIYGREKCHREYDVYAKFLDCLDVLLSMGEKDFVKMNVDKLVEVEELIDIDIVKIIKSGPATIVFFNDGEKIVVKRASDDEDSIYTAVAYAITKKIYGNNSHFKKIVNDHLIDQDNNSKNDGDPITHDILKDMFKDFKIGVSGVGSLKEMKE